MLSRSRNENFDSAMSMRDSRTESPYCLPRRTRTGPQQEPEAETERDAVAPTDQRSSQTHGSLEPPVEAGETRTVEIEDVGDQGDGITRVERGFVVIVSGRTKRGTGADRNHAGTGKRRVRRRGGTTGLLRVALECVGRRSVNRVPRNAFGGAGSDPFDRVRSAPSCPRRAHRCLPNGYTRGRIAWHT